MGVDAKCVDWVVTELVKSDVIVSRDDVVDSACVDSKSVD